MTVPSLRAHDGPPDAPASAPATGLSGARCVRYVVPVGSGRARVALTTPELASALGLAGLLGRRVGDDDELAWALHPAFDPDADDVRDGYRSAAVALDVVTDDGRRLLDLVAAEADGCGARPGDRPDIDIADQWNLRRVSLAPLAGATIAQIEAVFDVPPARGAVGTVAGWIDGVSVAAARHPGSAPSPSDRVPTTRGAHSSPHRSRGLTSPLTGTPHGGIHVAPATDLSNGHWTYTWNAHEPGPRPLLAGMLITRAPSIWIGDRGALGVRIGLTPDAESGVAAEEFDHDDEEARPHRYDVRTRSGIRISAAATDHAAVIETALPRAGRVVFTSLGVPLSHAALLSSGAGDAELEVASTVPSPHESDPLAGYASVRITGGDLRTVISDGRVVVDVEPGNGTLRIEIGTSQISTAHAREARAAVAGRSVAEVSEAARALWDARLSIVEAIDADDESRVLLASDLYRLFLFPTRHDEDTVDGPVYPSPTRRSSPDRPDRSGRDLRRGRIFTDNGFWDTYRTCWPAYALLAPAHAGDLLNGMLEHVRDSGWSPRWTAGTPLDAMVGTSLDVIAADLVSAGVPGIDLETAYAAALRNATTPSPDPRFGRKGMPSSLVRGYVEAEVPESVSWTLEGAIADAGAAVLAREAARREPAESPRRAELRAEARYLAHRAGAYRSLWDTDTAFFRPRSTTGAWADEPFDPRVWGGAHTETNAWTSRFGVPHDGAGLAALFGGREGLREALDDYFRLPETGRAEFAGSYGTVIHEMSEARDVRRGMWGISNQPAHHVPWLYAHTDTPWRAGEIVRDAVDRLFRGVRIGQGYPGDEDNGEMSAWRLFGVLGWAPFAPGSGRLLILPPRHERMLVRPAGAAPVEIRATRKAPEDRYIRSVRWNGQEWTSPTIGIDRLRDGGLWEVELGRTPVAWHEPVPSRPFFAPDGVTETSMRDVTVTDPGRVPLARGTELDIAVEGLGEVADRPLLVVSLAEPGAHSFEVTPAGSSSPTTAVRDARWRWSGQARPFEVAVPPGTRGLRLRWTSGPATLTAVRLLVPTP